MQKHLIAALGGLIVVTAALSAQNDWRTYGNDSGHQRFSTLSQITPENVGQLNKAWEFDTGVKGRKWQNTPVVIDGLMYVTLQNGGVVALEPESGQELWRYEIPIRGRSLRAVSYWPGDNENSARLLYGANDKLIALDPKNGKPIESFGDKGTADVNPGMPDAARARASARPPRPAGPAGPGGAGRPNEEGGPPRGASGFPGFSLSSPPAIYKNLARSDGGCAGAGVVERRALPGPRVGRADREGQSTDRIRLHLLPRPLHRYSCGP